MARRRRALRRSRVRRAWPMPTTSSAGCRTATEREGGRPGAQLIRRPAATGDRHSPAIIRRPSILILDEATNAVDGISEAAIMALLREELRHAIIIVINHRSSHARLLRRRGANRGGRVIESGPVAAVRASGMAMKDPAPRQT